MGDPLVFGVDLANASDQTAYSVGGRMVLIPRGCPDGYMYAVFAATAMIAKSKGKLLALRRQLIAKARGRNWRLVR